MNEEIHSPASPIEYKERQIVLTPEERSDGTWACHYSIIEPGSSLSVSRSRSQGTFPSREAAELAALQKAKAQIDL